MISTSTTTTTHHHQPIRGLFIRRTILFATAVVFTIFTLLTTTVVDGFVIGSINYDNKAHRRRSYHRVKSNHNGYRIDPKLHSSWPSSSFLLSSTTEDAATTGSFTTPPSSSSSPLPIATSRRNILHSTLISITASTVITATTTTANPKPVSARYVLDEEGEYIKVAEEDWKDAWKSRLDKASTMSRDDIFNAARGAGNLDLKERTEDGGYVESDASRKRRAMSACRDDEARERAVVGGDGSGGEGRPLDLKECNQRVMMGEVDFILDKL